MSNCCSGSTSIQWLWTSGQMISSHWDNWFSVHGVVESHGPYSPFISLTDVGDKGVTSSDIVGSSTVTADQTDVMKTMKTHFVQW